MTFVRSASLLGATQILNLVLTLISRIVLARYLGPVSFGAFGAASNAMSVSSRVLSLGTASGSQYFASRAGHERGALVGTSLVLAVAVGMLSLGATFLMLPVLQTQFFATHPQGMQAMLFLAWSMPVVVVAMNLGVMLIPFRQVRAYSAIQVLGGLAFLLPFLVLVQFLPPMQAAIWTQTMVWVTSLLAIGWFLREDYRALRWDGELALELVRFGLKSWPNVCLSIGIASFSTLFGARYLSPVELSLFVLAMNIVEGLVAPHGAMGQLVLSKAAYEEAKSNPKVLRLLRVSVVLFLGVGLGLTAAGGLLIPLVFGSDFGDAYPICIALFTTGVLHALMKVMGNAFAGAGRPGLATASLGGELVVFFGAIFWLGPYGIWGVVGATVLASVAGWVISAEQMRRLAGASWGELVVARRDDFVELRRQLSKPAKVEVAKVA